MPVNSFLDYPMTWKPDRNKLKRPVYLSLADMMEADIRAGLLRPGTKLPPQRELADFLDINFTTVTRTYKLCEMKGLIYAETGRGTFVSQHAARSITITADNSIHSSIDLAFEASFEQCNGMVSEVARRVTGRKNMTQYLTYDDPAGSILQRKAGIAWVKRLGMTTDIRHIAITSGAQNALELTLLALFAPGDRIAVDTYTYANFIELAKFHHLQLVPVDGDANGMLPDELAEQCTQMHIKGIFLMPSCCNPTTVVISEKRKRALADVIQMYQLILIEDDISAFLAPGVIKDYQGPLSRLVSEQSIYICSTSKSICSGLRVAYMVYAEAFREKLNQALFNVNVKTSGLNVQIVTELINTGRADEIVAEKRRLAAHVNQIFNRYFPEAPQTEQALAFYRWLPIPKKFQGIEAENFFAEHGVQVFHSSRFAGGSPKEEQFLRVALSTVSEDQLEIGLDILRKLIGPGQV